MKRLFILFVGLVVVMNVLAQTYSTISYQIVIRKQSNSIVSNAKVGMRISILQGNYNGSVVYAETQNPMTNINGLITIEIGLGTVMSGTFTSINWANGPYFVKTETDPNGSSNYEVTSVYQLLSVPYALSASNGVKRVSLSGDSLILVNGKYIIFPGISSKNLPQPPFSNGPNITDVDGNTYNTITIGNQTWMAENLRSSKYSDGTGIHLVTSATSWSTGTTPKMCWYNNDLAIYTTNKYGALYNWYAVSPTTNGNKNLCPSGWHAPTDAEWAILINYLGGESVAGGKMKNISTWYCPNIGATNESGFSGHPGGYRTSSGTFNFIGTNGNWWSSSEDDPNGAWSRNLHHDGGNVLRNDGDKVNGFSVRCLKD